MKTFKLIALIALIFAAGFVAGIVVTRVVVRHLIQRAIAQPDLARERIERALDRRLRLDADQEKRAHEILLDASTQLKALRTQFQPEFAGIASHAQEKISAILTPEQQKRFERFQAEHREMFQPN
jgi:hypothetical protein